MPKVEFIFDQDCPNVEDARANLIKAFTSAKLTPKWTEWNRNDASSPSYARKYGSPTILVAGKDISGVKPSENNNCRVYRNAGRNTGIPSIELIAAALTKKSGGFFRSTLTAIPGVGVILLPKLTCAACWPAYAAIMSSFGVGFFNYTDYLFPISIAALAFALGALIYKAKTRRGYGPFWLGLAASCFAIVGKFYIESDSGFYFGVVTLIVASFWNSWPKKSVSQACGACET